MLDDNYIKMALALPDDFFKDWKWQYGDQFITYVWKHGEQIPENVRIIGDSDLLEGKVGRWLLGDFIDYACKMRPLPSQRQLQDMLINPKTPIDLDVWKLLEEFQKFVSVELIRHHESGVYLENSFDVLWLKFVMFYKYKMLWKREVWVKIEDKLSAGIDFP
jgi:hypothetical protein